MQNRELKRTIMKSHDKTSEEKQNSFSGVDYGKIEFNITKPGEIRLNIFDFKGKSIYQWTGYAFKSGPTSITWNAKDNKGNNVPSGDYPYMIQSPGGNSNGKITIKKKNKFMDKRTNL
jgi:flagellar hook assembly protein FlgD